MLSRERYRLSKREVSQLLGEYFGIERVDGDVVLE
jgi:hypothetical protein